MKLFWVTIAIVLALAVPRLATAQPAPRPTIDWRVQDRFRLFDQADGAARARVETLMQRLAQVEGQPDLSQQYGLILRTLSGYDAASLRTSNWSPTERQYSAGYLQPAFYRVEVRLGSQARPQGVCTWSVAGQVIQTSDCEDAVSLELPAGPRLGGWQAAATVRAEFTGGAAEQVIVVDDELIVAIGDSFMSGEGNPDVPADLSGIVPNKSRRTVNWPVRLDPTVDGLKVAEWWDEPCHRSLLSWPVVSTLAHAAQDPHRVVTFVHLGCSGATVPEGLIGPQTGLPGCPEHLDEPRACPPGRGEGRSQFSQLRRLLGSAPQRRIDKVLLSIGGNDIGFVGVIAFGLLPPNGFVAPDALAGGLAASEGGVICPDREVIGNLRRLCHGRTAQERFSDLPARYNRVSEELTRLGVTGSQVYQTEYPDILHADRNDRFCHHAWREANILSEFGELTSPAARPYADYHDENIWRVVPAGFEVTQTEVPWLFRGWKKWSFQYELAPDFHCDPERVVTRGERYDQSDVCASYRVWVRLNRAVAANGSADRGWTIIDGHVDATMGHGWCLSDDRYPLDLSVAQADPDTGEFTNWGFLRASGDRNPALDMAQFRGPAEYDPYDPDQPRWFRTSNDSFRTQYGGPARLIQGTVHPTFRAHVAYAQAVLARAFPRPGAQ